MESANDFKAARQTYEGFTALIKWAIPVIAAIVILVIILIT
jgi:hypothetical protein